MLLAGAMCQYTSYFFIRIPQIGPASVFLISGQIKLKFILNFYAIWALLILISFFLHLMFLCKNIIFIRKIDLICINSTVFLFKVLFLQEV